jgi:hypothetical protein
MTGPLLQPLLDADLGDAIAGGLLGPRPRDLAEFEQAFTARVESGHPDPARAWDGFYDATLARVAVGWGRTLPGTGTIATFTRVWARTTALQRGPTALDVGTCFGFLPLAWSALPGAPRLVAADLSPGASGLVGRQARRLRLPVGVVCADGTSLPLPDRAVGTVHLVHVLEHVRPALGALLLREALRVADRRVVVAVPVELMPDPVFGHVQVFDLARLAVVGARTGWHVSLIDADGAWLVLDRPGAAVLRPARPPRRYIGSRPSWPDR